MTLVDNVNSTVISLLLSIFCVGIVFLGGWHFQYSIVELQAMVTNQQEIIMEQNKEIIEQKRQLEELLLQQQFVSNVKSRLKVEIYLHTYIAIATVYILKIFERSYIHDFSKIQRHSYLGTHSIDNYIFLCS